MKTCLNLIALTSILALAGFTPAARAGQTVLVAAGTTNTTGIVINGGNDTIIVETNATVAVFMTNVSTVVAVDPGGGTNWVENQGRIRSSGTFTATPGDNLTVVGIRTGPGRGTVFNNQPAEGAPEDGLIETSAVSRSGLATGSEAIGIRAMAAGIASQGNDTILNTGIIKVATTNTVTRSNPLNLSFIGLEKGTNLTTAEAIARGIASRSGDSSMTSTGAVSVTANAKINPFEIKLTLEDMASADPALTASATATGIGGGTGTSSITNAGPVTATASAEVSSAKISLTLANAATADTTQNANATAQGIAGGAGENTIHNSGQTEASATAAAKAIDVSLSFDAVAKADAMLASSAEAVGVAGGAAGDRITNDGSITATANSDATRTGVSATLYDFTAAQELLDAAANNQTSSKALAVGVDGGLGNDALANLGQISANATSAVHALDVSLSSVGVPSLSQITNVLFGNSLATVDRIAAASAKGMASAMGSNNMLNAGSISAVASAETDVKSVTVGIALPIPLGVMPGIPVATAGSSNTAAAVGIEGGAGSDTIVNASTGVMKVGSTSEATALGVAANLDFGLGGTNASLSISVPLVNAMTLSDAQAGGINSGGGNDSVRNEGYLETAATVDALSVIASLNLALTVEGVGIGVPIADASTIGRAAAVGIQSGAGNDTIVNAAGGSSKVSAKSEASSWLASADIKGAVKGLDVGVAVATSLVLSEANATGIDGGSGNESIRNEGYLETAATAEADNKVVSLKVTGVATGVGVGVSIADASTTARTTATGILGAAGNDEIVNTASGTNRVTSISDVDSLGVSVSFVGPTEGLAVALGKVKAETTAEATALGMEGGDGANLIRNSGLTEASAAATNLNIAAAGGITVTLNTGMGVSGAQAEAGSSARVQSVGMGVGDGGSILINDGTIRAKAASKTESVSVGISLNIGFGVGVLDADASTDATAIAAGIQGGRSDDFITNSASGNLMVTSTSVVKSAAVAVNLSLIGAGWTDASATTTNLATGMAGGGGQDTVHNEGAVNVTADAFADGGTFNLTIGGAALADGTVLAGATALGLDGGAGNDDLTNSGEVEVLARAKTDVNSTSLAVGGDAEADATTAAVAWAAGMAGDSGHDRINNQNSVKVTADAFADGGVLGLGLAGAALAGKGTGVTTAEAIALGLDGGTGNDALANSGRIEVLAKAKTDVNSTSLVLAGDAEADAATAARAMATGMAGGAGNDRITNHNRLEVTGDAFADSGNFTLSLAGAALAGKGSGGTTAEATALGLDGGDGDDDLANAGRIEVLAKAKADVGSISFTLAGDAEGNAETIIRSTASGMAGGSGRDRIFNSGTNKVVALMDVLASSKSITVAGASSGDASTSAQATAIGIDGGTGDDVIENTGRIEVMATGTNTMRNSSYTGFGGAKTKGDVGVGAESIGIAGGAGADQIHNAGQILSEALAVSIADNFSWTLAGAAGAEALGKPFARAVGMATGGGIDSATNSGSLAVQARSLSTVVASSTVWFGGSGASPTNEARAVAVGIAGGDENDLLVNQGTLDLSSSAEATATGNGYGVVSFATQHASGRSQASAEASAIDAGHGTNIVENTGAIAVTADARTTVNARADEEVGFYNDLKAVAATQADALASGIVTGNGDDQISNGGTNRVVAKVNSTADAYSDGAWSNLGNANATADAVGSAKAVGIDAGFDPESGGGNDRIENTGLLETTVETDVTAKARADDVGRATATARAEASGIVAGNGSSTIINSGLVTVVSTNAKAAALITRTDAQENSHPSSSVTNLTHGIVVGHGNNLIANEGTLRVAAGASARSEYKADDTGSVGDASAATEVYGIKVGGGDNTIRNAGLLTVTSTNVSAITTNPDDEPDNATSKSAVSNRSYGVMVGDGANTVENTGPLRVEAAANATAISRADYYFADSDAKAFSDAYGMKMGHGANVITNSSLLEVTARARAEASAYADYGIIWDADWARAAATANATAFGISAGNGGNHIVNSGHINVTAQVETITSATGDADVKTRIQNAALQAVGIQTGDGNDTIINSGSISVMTVSNGVSRSATAIRTGGGNDQVQLLQGTDILGDVELGTGDDQLVLAGNPIVFGDLRGDEGTDSLVLQGAGSFGEDFLGSLLGFEQAVKLGPGTFTLWTGLPTMQRLEVTEGALELHGDYQFQGTDGGELPEGYFGTQVNRDGSYGQLMVHGEAHLDGTITVSRGAGPFSVGLTTFDVIVATNGVGNTFSSTNLPAARPLLSFGLNQLPDRVQVEALGRSFTTVARNRVERSVGDYLDRIVSGSSGDLADVLDTFQQLDEPQFASALSSLSPDSYDNYGRVTYGLVQQYSKSVQQRLNTIRLNSTALSGGAEQAVLEGHNPVLLAFAGSAEEAGGMLTRQRQRQAGLLNGVWAGGFGQWSEQQADPGYTGFEYRPWGVAIGYDRALSDEFTLGVSSAYSSADVNLDGNRGSGDIETYSGAAYASYFGNNLHFEGAVSYGYNDYENRRNLVIGGISRRAESSHHGHALGAFLAGGYVWQHNHWALEPFASLHYTHLDESSFRESGAGGVSLWVQDRQTQALVSELGLRLAYVRQQETFTVIPELSLAWNYDFDIDDRVVTASYAGSPNATFSLRGQDVEPHGLTTGAGLTVLFGKGVATSVRYNGEFRDRFSSHAVLGELRFSF